MNPHDLYERYRELQAYVGWQENDAALVHAVAGLLEPFLPALVDDFYAEIERHPRARKVITGGPAQIERLKVTLLRWVRDLLSGPYDRDYVLRRWQVGWRHVEIGLDHLHQVGVDTIQSRVNCLTDWLLNELLALTHGNGRHMVRIYGPANTQSRGGTVTLNLYDSQGHLLNYRRVEELAGAENISLRTGCFCNPGAGEISEGLTEEDMKAGFTMGAEINLLSFVRLMQERGHKSAGAIRASIGLATNFPDVWRFLRFIGGFRDQTRLTIGDVSFDIESCRIIRDGS